ncbi:outer membrane efflux protein [Labilithrix luteola]|uniref:Outer membrane efflux protein n=1 Tax=Labilithrix luteola TaxID=1391654 RepID=A0A0K1QDT8_9BACT|nr:outer membrane efflux protein [Labilithrix luteola]
MTPTTAFPDVPPRPPAGPVIRLNDAVETGLQNQPTLHQAMAQTRAQQGRAGQAKAGLLPQLTATASYFRVRGAAGRGTASGAAGTPSAVATSNNSAGVDVYSFGGNASQLLWDFGQTYNRYRAADRLVESFEATQRTTSQTVIVNVRNAYFTARAQKDLETVARNTLANQLRHLAQTQGMVSVGTQPEIALAQARNDVASARVSLINAQNAYDVSKAQLAQAMGSGSDGGDFEIGDDELAPVEGEDGAPELLFDRAMKNRPELVALARQNESQRLTVRSIRGAYWPTLTASGGVAETGTDLGELGLAWNVGMTLAWPFYQGGLTKNQVREAEANLDATQAQIDTTKLAIRVDVQQASLSIRAAKASKIAAEEAVANARERLRLAEGRYGAGVGSIIELGDAQIAFTNANAQLVQAQFQLASARANLLAALGQR